MSAESEKTIQELAHKAVSDMVQWIRESPTEEVRQYRIRLVMSAMNRTMEPQFNEEWGTLSKEKCND